MSTTFVVPTESGFSLEGLDEGDSPYIYTRWGNPTISQLEEKIALLENGEAAACYSTGMAAITSIYFNYLRAGDHAVIGDVIYTAASELANGLLLELNISITRVDSSNLESIRKAVIRGRTKFVYVESPCNPFLRLTDLAEVAKIAHEAGALFVVDSTFATPFGVKPLELGADLVIHSLTKYIGGHGDALGGAVVGRKAEIFPLKKNTANRFGGTISPFNAWLINRGLSTLPLRMRQHEETALKVARYLEGLPFVTKVIYPGLPSHPQHSLAKKMLKNFGGMVSFTVNTSSFEPDPASPSPALYSHARDSLFLKQFVSQLQIVHYAVSLGHHRSLLYRIDPVELRHTTYRLDTQAQVDSYNSFTGGGERGIFLRFSIGLESAEDIIKDLDRGFTYAFSEMWRNSSVGGGGGKKKKEMEIDI